MNRFLTILLLIFLLASPAGLAQEQSQIPEQTQAAEDADAETGAIDPPEASLIPEGDWREELGAFRIGIVSGGDISETVARAEPFRLAIAEALNMRVELFPARDFSALIDAASDSRIEYAVFSASAYALAWSLCECIEPLVVARSGDGAADYRQVLIASEGAVQDLESLKGKRIAMIETATVGGGLLALRELKQAGLGLDGVDAELVTVPTGEAALEALESGEADAVLGWSSLRGDKGEGYSRGTLQRIAPRGEPAASYTIVWQSSPIPHRTHAMRKNLPAQAKTILRSKLTAMFDADPVAYDSIEPIHGGGFIAARQGEYEALIELMRSKGVKAAE